MKRQYLEPQYMVGYGIFCWGGEERRSNRYGSFTLTDSDYNNTTTVTPKVNIPDELLGKRVRVVCKVVESRKSGHIGDLFLNIFPSQPEVSEEIELGIGFLHATVCDWSPEHLTIYLIPEDGRKMLWIDPRILYRLHDQTVKVFMEETTDACHAPPEFNTNEEGVKGAGEDEIGGFIQTKGVEVDEVFVPRKTLKPMGGGMFVAEPQSLKVGNEIKYEKKNK